MASTMMAILFAVPKSKHHDITCVDVDVYVDACVDTRAADKLSYKCTRIDRIETVGSIGSP